MNALNAGCSVTLGSKPDALTHCAHAAVAMSCSVLDMDPNAITNQLFPVV